MTQAAQGSLLISGLRGRNGGDPPFSLLANQCREAYNIDWYRSSLGRKRGGATSVATTGGTAFASGIQSLFRHVPAADESQAELWGIDGAGHVKRLAGGTAWADITLADAISSNFQDITAASLNNKLYFAYNAVGAFTAPAAPTRADNGVGTYAAIARFYRIRWIIKAGSIVTSRSPAGTAAASFTPSGTGLQVRVTRPALPGLGETHWELEASPDNINWFVLFGDNGVAAAVVAATATADDSFALTTTIQTFRSSGSWTAPAGLGPVTYLAVAGGAGGGSGADDGRNAGDPNGCGGGGAGGEVLTGTDVIAAGSVKTVTVGPGGSGSTSTANGSDGSDSSFNAHTAKGGSGGGWTFGEGTAGKLGGGAGGISGGVGGVGTKHSGGASVFNNGGDFSGGGGAGDSAVGGAAAAGPPSSGGIGGAGTANSTSGAAVTYGRGGDGGTSVVASNGSSGAGNTGNGGNGANHNGNGGDGGSGIVILSYGLLYGGFNNANSSIASGNRLHVWDPSDGTVRRAGLGAPSAVPTVANGGGAGAYAAVARYYKVCFTKQVNGLTKVRGELSAASAVFTPGGANANATVTRPAALGESETHWEVYGSADNLNYWRLSTIVLATTTYADTTLPVNYYTVTGVTAYDAGTYNPPPGAKYLVSDDARLIMAGCYSADGTTPTVTLASGSRIWWTSAPTATGEGDDERVSNTTGLSAIKSYADIEESVRGLSHPVLGSFLAFSYRSHWKFVSTGDPTSPYRRYRVTGGAGVLHHKTIVNAPDEQGNTCTYWLSEQGPMRDGPGGQQILVDDIKDIWDTINLQASVIVSHGIYHRDKHQIWWYIATNGSNTPNQKIVFDVRLGRVMEDSVRGGWSQQPGDSANAYCSCLFSNTLGVAMSFDLKPHIGYTTSTAIYKCDTADLTDNGTAFQGYVDVGPLAPWGLGRTGGLHNEAVLIAATAPATTVQLTLSVDEGARSQVSMVSLDPISDAGAETQVFPKFDAAAATDCNAIRLKIGDSVAVAKTWNLTAVVFEPGVEGTR